jgi:hypothetical protein
LSSVLWPEAAEGTARFKQHHMSFILDARFNTILIDMNITLQFLLIVFVRQRKAFGLGPRDAARMFEILKTAQSARQEFGYPSDHLARLARHPPKVLNISHQEFVLDKGIQVVPIPRSFSSLRITTLAQDDDFGSG